jgi:putative hemolysin
MVPMKDVFYIESALSIPDASTLIAKRGFTRVPVLDKNNDVIGILYSKELIDRATGLITPLLKPPFYVSSNDEITDTFESMKQKRVHMAMVKNSNGKVVGIVTLEDIVEELVGEIYDEYFETKYERSSNQPVAQV